MAKIQTRNDVVEHPNYYAWIPEIECVDVAEHFNFNLGCVIKYVWRAPLKDFEARIVDLEKAAFYIQLEKERVERAHMRKIKLESGERELKKYPNKPG